MYVITEFYENSAVILVPGLRTVLIRFSVIVANASQQLHFHVSVHQDIIYTKMTNKMPQVCGIIYYSLAALHVSSDIFAHHQEHLNCITASGITHVCRCQLAATYVCNTISCNTV